MCQGITGPTIDGRDEWYLDNPTHRAFIHQVRKLRANGLRRSRHGRDQRPLHSAAGRSGLAAGTLCEPAQRSVEWAAASVCGCSIAPAMATCVFQPGRSTRGVDSGHDHLAWGLSASIAEHRQRTSSPAPIPARGWQGRSRGQRTAHLAPGDLYELTPELNPQVTTTSDVTSVSLHCSATTTDASCAIASIPTKAAVEPFRSGWLNVVRQAAD